MRSLKFLLSVSCLVLCLSCSTSPSVAQDAGFEQNEFTQAQLDQMLAPIALYPDTLLSHILIAATYPIELVQAQRWSAKNGSPNGEEAVNAVEAEPWDPSVKALLAFPDVLEKMSTDLLWTQNLGDAFLQNEEQVIASVQELRKRAQNEGSLSELEYYDISEDDVDNIVIESRDKEVVYVPYYDSRVVYGPWRWHAYPPVYWSINPGIAFHWGPRIRITTGFYFSAFNWHSRNVVVVNRHRYNDHFYSGRQVARHRDARRWVHNPSHRHGVRYRSVKHFNNSKAQNYYSNRNKKQREKQSQSVKLRSSQSLGRDRNATQNRSNEQRRSDERNQSQDRKRTQGEGGLRNGSSYRSRDNNEGRAERNQGARSNSEPNTARKKQLQRSETQPQSSRKNTSYKRREESNTTQRGSGNRSKRQDSGAQSRDSNRNR